MDSNLITALATLVGIIGGFLASSWFSMKSEKKAALRHKVTLESNSILKGKNLYLTDALNATLNEALDGFADRLFSTSNSEASTRVRSEPPTYAQSDIHRPASTEIATQPTHIDLIVRASLGLLLDEHGQVEAPRLIRDVSSTLGISDYSQVTNALERLRSEGIVSWEGVNIGDCTLISVIPSAT